MGVILALLSIKTSMRQTESLNDLHITNFIGAQKAIDQRFTEQAVPPRPLP